MSSILAISVCVLLIYCVFLDGQVRKLSKDLSWWREEAIRLNNEKHKREE